MNEKQKKITAIVIFVLFIVTVFSFGWILSRHYSRLESSNGNDVRATIRNAERLNQDAQRELDEAIEYNQRARSANQDAEATTDRISESNDELSRINAENQAVIERAEQVIDDVDRANQ